uniref:M12 family metallopeptidase n=1 Tax=Roseihalotalea indica TaxID=2867963 RepID=A0AA49GJ23_9BACT|nr:M12 family metallopeptidase [Tunicatimonas sp. TK19036]
MATKKKHTNDDEPTTFSYCDLPMVPPRVFGPEVDPNRASAIVVNDNKWVNGTVIHYYFFDQDTDGETVLLANGNQQFRTWVGAEKQKDVVRQAFGIWKDLGIGLEFEEVDDREDAEVRIGFMQGDGSWSYIGTYVLEIGAGQRTMNFGWDLTTGDGLDTALHEIGHTLGLPHEHQNPNAGIVWDEEAVYAALAAPPNNWSRDTTYYNIIRKLDPNTVDGSAWDPDSIMHYPFGPGLILKPDKYKKGISPKGGLSDLDIQWMKTFYPPLEEELEELELFMAKRLFIQPGDQVNYVIQPKATRYYDIRTFGTSDTILVLFEDEDGELRYRTADDDSAQEYNAHIRYKLVKGRKYVLRARLYYQNLTGQFAIMMW